MSEGHALTYKGSGYVVYQSTHLMHYAHGPHTGSQVNRRIKMPPLGF